MAPSSAAPSGRRNLSDPAMMSKSFARFPAADPYRTSGITFMTDPLIIAGTNFSSRLIVGTARYPNHQVMLDCLEASGAELVTASIRRISLEGYAESLVDVLGGRYRLLPNTAGCV